MCGVWCVVCGVWCVVCGVWCDTVFFLRSFSLTRPLPFPAQSRELEISIYWKDWRAMSAVKSLRLEEFLDNKRHSLTLAMEPQGILFVEVCRHRLTFTLFLCIFACVS